MSVLTVGKVDIPYGVRYSATALHRRIVVTPEHVEVVVPKGTTEAQIADYIHRKRRWVYDQLAYMKEVIAARPAISKYITGAKIPFRGRRMRLTVSATPEAHVPRLTYRHGFHVDVPDKLTPQMNDFLVEMELRLWLKRQVRADVKQIIGLVGKQNDLKPKGFRIKEQKRLWGSCGKDRIININWLLIFAPKAVLEYAVAHELCHLKHRNHGKEFWALVERIQPDYRNRKKWLDDNEYVLSWNGLVV